MKNILIFILLVSWTEAFCQISPAYLEEKSSNAIVLEDQTILTIESPLKSTLKRTYKAIIKNRYTSHLRNISLHVTDPKALREASVKVLNMAGNEIKVYKERDFQNLLGDWNSVASDARLLALRIKHKPYPYILSVSYEIDYNNSLHYPVWQPQAAENLRIQSATLTVVDKPRNSIRYHGENIGDPTITQAEGAMVYFWELKEKEPFKYVPYTYSLDDYAPVVYLAASTFTVDGHPGKMDDWQSFGFWVHGLNEGKDDINTLQIPNLDARVEAAATQEEKVAIVYDYLQNNTRYVSIQLGIGGWQPFSASYVHEKKYGDCKALSNFTKSLLARYGIKSYYTLIRAGKYAAEVKEDFPNAHFNHAILTVPFNGDTTFLECTSQTNPYGYMGTFTSNRNALLITEEGGKLIRTKKYVAEENLQQTKVTIDITTSTNPTIIAERTFSGIEVENQGFLTLYNKSLSEQEKWFVDELGWGDITSMEMIPLHEGEVPRGGFKVSFRSESEAKRLGKRLFLSPGKYLDNYVDKPNEDKRDKPLHLRYGYAQVDTIVFTLPKHHNVEKALKPYKLETVFGSYERVMIMEGATLTYIRKFIFRDGKFPAESYTDFKNFIDQVNRLDREKIVLINKT